MRYCVSGATRTQASRGVTLVGRDPARTLRPSPALGLTVSLEAHRGPGIG